MDSAPRAVPPSLNGWNPEYLDAEHARYLADPASVEPDLRAFFQGLELGLERSASGASPPLSGGAPNSAPVSADGAHFQYAVDHLVEAYREFGHMASRLDPFERDIDAERPSMLRLDTYGLGDADLDKALPHDVAGVAAGTPLRDLIARLDSIYCGSVGIEYWYIQDPEERAWFRDRVESGNPTPALEPGLRVHLLEQLVQAESFERFLARRYPGEKRFSLEGAETLIPMLNHLLESAAMADVFEVVLGMAHRGRLNVLNNVLSKSHEQIFTEFEDSWEEDFVDGGGDVKYHRGYSATRNFAGGRQLHLAMASNPSHLEAVDGVVLGRTRAKQRLRHDTERKKVVPVLIHGDAAIAGQGVVAECLNMSQLEGYTVGGCVHIVVNNLIGFTTIPEDGRSSRYCTDVAKMISAPVLHVNGEDPEAAMICAEIAIEYRQKFKKDLFIDLHCYRRYGHNEQDEASFTQPVLAKLISERESVLHQYSAKLRADNVITDRDIEVIEQRLMGALEKAQELAQQTPHDPTIDPGSYRWAGMRDKFSFDEVETAITPAMLDEICAALGKVPEGFEVNRKLKKLLKERAALPETKKISYADAETLAYGALLLEGHPVRVSGQDSRRGTFSHRHAVLRDATDAKAFTPLNNIREVGELGTDHAPGTATDDGKPRQAKFCIYDSPLSEASVMAFDYGYSLADPDMLVCWEGQFGDFCNGAQVIIDQFIASASQKWQRWSGLTLLLPHGYEGAGPEHSSARLERFLKLCGDSNMQVIYPTTGAQIFHVLRRQLKRAFRVPLVVMTPKSMLRIPTSTIDELTSGTFQEVLDDGRHDDGASASGVKRVLLCSGKIYFELAARRDAAGRDDVAIVRIEQLYPFHTEAAAKVLAQYGNATQFAWVQEEPRNMGAFHFFDDIARNKLGIKSLEYIGRQASGSPATGSKSVHKQEQEAIIARAVAAKPAESGAKGKSKATQPA